MAKEHKGRHPKTPFEKPAPLETDRLVSLTEQGIRKDHDDHLRRETQSKGPRFHLYFGFSHSF